ncbi:MAG TPA: peptidylprolyl isomerase [Bacteroidota bacterium]|nr:peptidylprolyl isomerase [Bacteroidota bacterium]
MKQIIRWMLVWHFIQSVALSQTVVDRIVAVVDKEIITESELHDRAMYAAMQNHTDPTNAALRKQILDGLITEKLILAQAAIDSVQVTDEEVNRAVEQRVAAFVRQVGSEQRVEQMYGKPVNIIKREIRSDIKNQLLVDRVRQQREATLSVTKREVEDFYKAYKDSLPPVPEDFELSHIYIVPKPDSSLEAKTRQFAQTLLDSLRTGADFSTFAKRYSADPGSAATGGDLGWEKRGVFVHDFEETVFRLKDGDISDIVKTQFGFHIIQLLERRGESVHARHILLRIEKGPASDSTAVQQLRALRERALKGESFATLASKYSEDEDTKSIGGDLGELTADQLQADFATQVKSLKEGEISEPIRTVVGSSYGYHIIWVRKRMAPHTMTLDGDFHRLEQLALYMKKNKSNAEWIEELKKSIYVDIRL